MCFAFIIIHFLYIIHYKNVLIHLWCYPCTAMAGNENGGSKEITFEVEAVALPKNANRRNTVFIRQVSPTEADVMNNHDYVLIFLHGAAFSSATWSELGILSELARQGYISYALDIPGFGQSVQTVANNAKWLRVIIEQLVGINGKSEVVNKQVIDAGGVSTIDKKKFVLVTASMSGRYAIPLLFDNFKEMIGMITIAPVATDRYTKEQYEGIDIPICIIYGELDRKLGIESKENLIQIPNHKVIVVPGGQHPAYKSDPIFFHQQVVKWLTEFCD